jgi:hypothetical protein
MFTETHTITLNKPAKRQLRENVILSNIATLLASVNTKSLKVSGWTVSDDMRVIGHLQAQAWKRRYASSEDDAEGAEYVYEMYLVMTYDSKTKEAGKQDVASIARKISSRASQAPYGSWNLVSIDDEVYAPPADDSDLVSGAADQVGYADCILPSDFEDNFSHLYGLDNHIARVRGAIEAAIMSNWNNRFHVALIGPPGCGKSEICRSVRKALGDDAVMEFDATATTAAGAMKELGEIDILPRILVVEEIEKAPTEQALSWLLALADQRGEIRKTTARASIQRDTKLLVIATVNDFDLFKTLQKQALASRFSNQVWFKRPSREMLTLIVTREVDKVNGDHRWIQPAIDFCEKIGTDDPRTVIAHTLCGRDLLLTGEYQQMMSDTAPPTNSTPTYDV